MTARPTSQGTEARLLVSTGLNDYGDFLDDLGLAAGTRHFAELVSGNAILLEALEADGWQLAVDEIEEGEVILCGVRRFASLDEALAAARVLPGALGRTLGWGIGNRSDNDEDSDEYLPVE